MPVHFLHISLEFKGDSNTEALKKEFNKAIDWVHYMSNCWIVLTSSDSMRWYERLAAVIGDEDHLFICPVDMEEAKGWISKWVIDWIEAAKQKAVQLPLIPGPPEGQKQIPEKSS